MTNRAISRITRGYICRGCGTSITTPASFKKCPVCGIKFG